MIGEFYRDLMSSTGAMPVRIRVRVAAVPGPESTAAAKASPQSDPPTAPENPWLGSLAEQYASVLRVAVRSTARPTAPAHSIDGAAGGID